MSAKLMVFAVGEVFYCSEYLSEVSDYQFKIGFGILAAGDLAMVC